MNGAVITHILNNDPQTCKWFQGFATPDTKIYITHKPALIILNTDKSNGPGEHWCVAIFLKNNVCEFFDPYGFSPVVYDFKHILLEYAHKIKFNTKRVQGNAPTCGHHCIFFALNRSRKKSVEKIMRVYSMNLKQNDAMVYKFVQNLGVKFAHFCK